MTIVIRILFSSLIFLIFFPACGKSPKEYTKVRLRLNWYAFGEVAPLYLAKEKGFYKAEGLQVEILEGRGSSAAIKELGENPDQFVFADTGTMIRMAAEGLPLKTVGIFVQLSPMALMFKSDIVIDSAQDLIGKRIAVSTGSSARMIFPAVLSSNNLEPSSIEYITSPTTIGKRDMLLQGKADVMLGYYINHPIALKHEKNIILNWKPYHELGVNALSDGLIVHDQMIQENPELIRKMARAVQKGFQTAQKNPGAAAKILAAIINPEKETVFREQLEISLKLLRTPNSKRKPIGWISEKDWRQTAEILQKYAKMQGKLESHNYYTNEFLSQIE